MSLQTEASWYNGAMKNFLLYRDKHWPVQFSHNCNVDLASQELRFYLYPYNVAYIQFNRWLAYFGHKISSSKTVYLDYIYFLQFINGFDNLSRPLRNQYCHGKLFDVEIYSKPSDNKLIFSYEEVQLIPCENYLL